jgi:hypothetical protein
MGKDDVLSILWDQCPIGGLSDVNIRWHILDAGVYKILSNAIILP